MAAILKKQKRSETKRTDSVTGTVDAKDGTIEVRFDRQSDRIEIVGAEPESLRTERTYVREGGKRKVVSSVPSRSSEAPFSSKDALLEYDWVMAVDTDQKKMNGKVCAVSFSYFVAGKPKDFRGGIPFMPMSAYWIEGVNQTVHAEKIGWFLALESAPKRLPSGDRLALVVDCDFEMHKKINRREVGYIGNLLLPHPTTLVYASTDRDNETLGGQMIRFCHSASQAMWRHIEGLSLPHFKLTNIGNCCEGICQIKFPRSK